jgi:phenylalanyl-tRNA synthetase alpha chain
MTSEDHAEKTDARVLAVAQEVAALADPAVAEITRAATSEELEKLRVTYLGKQSKIILLSKELGKVPPEVRPAFGEVVNSGKKRLQEALSERKAALDPLGRHGKSTIDVTLPGLRKGVGKRHPLMQTMEAVKTVVQGMGFRYDDYPEVETEYHNFDSLNTPKWHPSRDMHDSFYTKAGGVVRTHTTAFQVRAMRRDESPPIRAMTSGRCYRRDEIDATHFPIFNQLDVIAIDRAISFADLKWTLDRLIRALLGPEVKLQFRPSFFPFTTPSAEVDVFYRGRWMELLGSGMIRPEVLRNGGIDPDLYQGFAFGMGIDRLTMARYEESFLTQF